MQDNSYMLQHTKNNENLSTLLLGASLYFVQFTWSDQAMKRVYIPENCMDLRRI